MVCSNGYCSTSFSTVASPKFIIAGVTAVLILLIVIGACLFFCIRSRRARRRREFEQRHREQVYMQQQQQHAYHQQPVMAAYPQSPAPSHVAPFATPYPAPPPDHTYPSPQPTIISPVAVTPGSAPPTPGGYGATFSPVKPVPPLPYGMPMPVELPSNSILPQTNSMGTALAQELPADEVQPKKDSNQQIMEKKT